MDEQKPKTGVSVKEIETFTKKHRFEVFFCLSLILSCFFSFVFFDGWGTVATAVGGILGILFSTKIAELIQRFAMFFNKQEDLTQLILGIAGLVLSVFLPILTFLVIGTCGGIYLHQLTDTIFPQEVE
ncbi:MAG: hypothetical protein V4489_09290 [Chlamydiota bacterium]